MSRLTVVRHAQAGPFETNSGCLSETGQLQARALAAYWIRRDTIFDEVYTGTLARHRQTEAIVAEAYRAAGRAWPTAHELPELNEYDAEGIIRAFAPAADLTDPRAFQLMFEDVMGQWLEGAIENSSIETWPQLRDRVLAGLAKITAGPVSRRIVAFTSGGPIGLLVQTALGAPARGFLEANWRVRNTSITEFVFSAPRSTVDIAHNAAGHERFLPLASSSRAVRFTLDSFNALPHLDDPALLTFR
ncbi:MAG TPA: histidine phosphatase family protein [Bryobacteraceae bacterium]|nr:histidine phosphatase family protein [Bryobacteraceae bacterium]